MYANRFRTQDACQPAADKHLYFAAFLLFALTFPAVYGIIFMAVCLLKEREKI